MKCRRLLERVGLVLVMVLVVPRVVWAQVPTLKSLKDVENLDVKDLRELLDETWLVPDDKNEFLVELYTKMIERLQELPETDRLIGYAYVGRGMRREGLGDIKGAIRDYTKAIEVDPLFPEAYGSRAEARMKLGDTKGAQRDGRAAIEAQRKVGDPILREIKSRLARNPEDVSALCDRAFREASRGDYEGAIRDYKRALEFSEDKDDKWSVLFYLIRAQEYIGDYQSAIANASRAIDLFPDQDSWYMTRAKLRASAGDLEGSRADLQEYLGRKRREKVAEIQKLTESLNENPNDARLLLNRAEDWRYLGEYDKALSDVRKALAVASETYRKQWGQQLEAKIRRAKREHQQCEYERAKRILESKIMSRYQEDYENRGKGRAKTP